MFNYIRSWLDKRVIKRSSVTLDQWEEAFASLPLLTGLTVDEKQTLRELAILFMHHKAFEGAQGFVINHSQILVISLQACLPILKLGFGAYGGWHSVIVYPSGFATKRVVMDEFGVAHNVESDLLGESWQRGPVVLSWDDTEHAGIIDGENLVIHEFAHKLDMQNGVANGFPPMNPGMHRSAWLEAFSAGFDDFQDKCRRGKHIGIDCYASTSPAEFFAVLSEVFFECPDVILEHYSAIYDCLRQYYRQDPLSRLSSQKRNEV